VDQTPRLDALRLSEAEQSQLLAKLERAAHHVNVELRCRQRYRYHVREGLSLQIAASNVAFVVRPRNLSAGGISVLHGAFLYPSTQCTITLKTLAGEPVRIPGRVVRCRCVHGRAHEVNIGFNEPIEMADFLAPGQARCVSGNDPDAPAGYRGTDVAALARRLQVLADERAPLEQLAMLIEKLVDLLRVR
jgi:hypothetical protein